VKNSVKGAINKMVKGNLNSVEEYKKKSKDKEARNEEKNMMRTTTTKCMENSV